MNFIRIMTLVFVMSVFPISLLNKGHKGASLTAPDNESIVQEDDTGWEI